MDNQGPSATGAPFPEAQRVLGRFRARLDLQKFVASALASDLIARINDSPEFSLAQIEQLAGLAGQPFTAMSNGGLYQVLQQIDLMQYQDIPPSLRPALPQMMAEATGIPEEQFRIKKLRNVATVQTEQRQSHQLKSRYLRLTAGLVLALLSSIMFFSIFPYGNKLAAIIADFTNIFVVEPANNSTDMTPDIPRISVRSETGTVIFAGTTESTSPAKAIQAMSQAVKNETLNGRLYKVQLKVERLSDADYGDQRR